MWNRRWLSQALIVLAAVSGLTRPANAQTGSPASNGASEPDLGIVGIGVGPLHDNDSALWLPNGLIVSARVLQATERSGVVLEFGSNWRYFDAGTDSLTIETYLGGVRIGPHPGRRTRPFGQVLGGLARIGFGGPGTGGKVSALAIQPGVGVDYSLNHAIGLRAQGDFRILRRDGFGTTELRLAFGIIFGR